MDQTLLLTEGHGYVRISGVFTVIWQSHVGRGITPLITQVSFVLGSERQYQKPLHAAKRGMNISHSKEVLLSTGSHGPCFHPDVFAINFFPLHPESP